MSTNLPQLVIIRNLLPSAKIEEIRKEIKEFQQRQNLTDEQVQDIKNYSRTLNDILKKFIDDNTHVENNGEGVTDADTQMYNGLKNMYVDYMTELEKLRTNNVDKESNNILEDLSSELPYQQPTERKTYIDGLIQSSKVSDSIDTFTNNSRFLDAIVNLCILDSSINDNLRSYLILLRKVGYSNKDLIGKLPEGLSDVMSLTASEDTPNELANDENKEVSETSLDDERKKKISFSKYLKKTDTEVGDNGKRLPEVEIFDVTSEESSSKRQKYESGSYLPSILKATADDNGNRMSPKKKSTNSSGIKFVDDSRLVTIFGEGLPKTGLQLSPEELKKVLKPFNEGEPREVFTMDGMVPKARELAITLSSNADNISDISKLKGGPIPCETATPLKYRINFTKFSPDLNKTAREPVVVDEKTDKLGKPIKHSPLIARAFGRNNLLLRSDRGGLSYKRVPEVVQNNYLPRATE